LKSSTRNMQDIFKEFDADNNGWLSQVEFRNSIRKLNLGLTSKDIDGIIARLDTNQDGRIDYNEFAAKFAVNDYEGQMMKRVNEKMARVKELMILHMTSANDAFRFVSKSAHFGIGIFELSVSFS